MKTFNDIGIQIPQFFLPEKSIDLTKWAVIACDQFTSQPEYWREVEKIVGNAPSTLHLILPEVYLEQPDNEARLERIHSAMRIYLEWGLLLPHEGFVYIERTAMGKMRKGVMLCLDLERYDYSKGSASLIRATEGTIVERIQPRVKVRQGAALELPHILVLVDDPLQTVIEPLAATKEQLEKLYDFDLMLDSGHLAGYAVSEALEEKVVAALHHLAQPEVFSAKYGVSQETPVLLFAMGDGNHSLATAKTVWEKIKPQMGMDHPARYALVEIENVHDDGLDFEPIHRVLFGLKKDILGSLESALGRNFNFTRATSAQKMIGRVDEQRGSGHLIGLVGGCKGFGVVEIANPPSNLPVGTLQVFLDKFVKEGGADKIDYVHGADVVCELGAQPGNAGFYVPGMNKSDLFKTVILDGALPHKTFSMGEAREKRFYVESRKIV